MSQQRTKSGPFEMADFLLKRISGRSTFIRAWFVVGCLMLVSSCLSPQSIEMEEAAPRLPPVIDAKSVTPENSFTCIDSTTSTKFHLTVRAPDGQKLQVRWFIDYDPTSSTAIRAPTSPDPHGDGTLPLSVDFDQSDLGSLQPVGVPHTVEVVIATDFDEDRKAFPPGRAIPEGAYSASNKWVIVVAPEGCQ